MPRCVGITAKRGWWWWWWFGDDVALETRDVVVVDDADADADDVRDDALGVSRNGVSCRDTRSRSATM